VPPRMFGFGCSSLVPAGKQSIEKRDCRECLLRRLRNEEREVLTEYYRFDKIEKINCRKRLAARLGVSLNTLRRRCTKSPESHQRQLMDTLSSRLHSTHVC
jgi:hypothetical protein